MTSSPGSHTASRTWPRAATEPLAVTTLSGATARCSATASTSSVAYMSGYRLTSTPASAIAAITEGSGGNGFSFDESLYAAAPTGTRAPGT